MRLEKIRLASPEEVEEVRSTSDLTPTSRVLVMGNSKAVWRICNEIDPWYYKEGTSLQERMLFTFAIQNFLVGAGASEFYFNVHADDDKARKGFETIGATLTSTAPEVRYKIQL